MPGLRTFGADSNSAASQFVGIPVPVGVQDGDLVLVAIAVTASGIEVQPPSAEWTQLVMPDTQLPVGLALFWKFAFNEGANWIFALSASITAAGAALVYYGVEPFEPIEFTAQALTPSGTAQNVGGLTSALPNEELALFAAAGASGSFTPATGFEGKVAHAQTGLTIEAHRRALPGETVVAPFTVTFSASAAGASILVTIRPGAGRFTLDEVRQRIVRALPPGVDRVYDLQPGGDYYKLYGITAAVLKVYGYDLVDLIEQELTNRGVRYLLPRWEALFGKETTRTSRSGTVTARQDQFLAAWRAAAGVGASIEDIQQVLGTLMGYDDPTQVEILEVPRDDLTAAHEVVIDTVTNGGI